MTESPALTAPPSEKSLGYWLNFLGPVIGLIVIAILFRFLAGPTFLSASNIETMLRQSAVVSIAALGMTLLIISGAIDLSVGSAVALCSVLLAVLLKLKYGGSPLLDQYPIAWPLACAAIGILVGALCGFFNGILITSLRVAPFIVTLGSMMIFRGLAKGFADEKAVNPSPSWLEAIMSPPTRGIEFTFRGETILLSLAWGTWLYLALALVVALLLNYSRFGRHIIAVGSNEQTARLCGIAVTRVKILVFTLAGFFLGLAGLLQFSRTTQGNPTSAMGLELDVIAAVVIGGASLSGGRGSILGTLVGALIMNVIRSGCSQMDLPTYLQEIVTGAIIVAAVALDRLRTRSTN